MAITDFLKKASDTITSIPVPTLQQPQKSVGDVVASTEPGPMSVPPIGPQPNPTTTQVPTTTTPTAPQQPTGTTQPLTYDPAVNPSVVDLLNTAGQDASFANRQTLAQQYGIQNYTGTAQQNVELGKKFTEAFNQLKGGAVPETGATAGTALDQHFAQKPGEETPQGTPEQRFFDTLGAMNPIEANLFQQLSGLLSATNNQQSLREFYDQEFKAQGIEALNLELADINRIMEGTEDDIRAEISNSGGFATDSQVRALTGARNKTLLKQANYLSNVLQSKNDYLDRIVSLTQADRAQVSADLDRKLGITETLFNMSQSMTNAAKDNYKMVIDSVGWEGLAQSIGDNPSQQAYVENLFGLGKGALKALAKYKKPLTEMETLDLENQRLQNAKLRADIATGPSVPTQVVDVNGKKVLINSKTGATIAEIGDGDGVTNELQQAMSLQNVTDIQSIVDSPYLDAAVGPSKLGRYSPLEWVTGGKSTFVGEMDNLISQLTLDSLIQAKAKGATFGALSEGELKILAAAANPLGSPAWTVRDDEGNLVGWKVSENEVREKLDTINHFAKLDFVLKGGSIEEAGVVATPDGMLWYENYDGTLTQLR